MAWTHGCVRRFRRPSPGCSHDARCRSNIAAMAGGVIEVRSSERLGLLEWLWLPGLLRAFWIAARRLYRRGPRDEGVAPHARAPHVRGMPALITDEGILRCVGCELCAEICPAGCIRVQAHSGAVEAAGPGSVEAFEIDMARCLYCGLCEEACPAFALAMTPLVEIAAAERAELVFDLEALSVPAALLAGRGSTRPAVVPGDDA